MIDLEQLLREHFSVPPENRLDIEHAPDGPFRAVEVRPDLSIGRRFFGGVEHIGVPTISSYAISLNEEPDLSPVHLRVYDAIRSDWERKIHEAEDVGAEKFFLMRDGDHPELFASLQTAPANIGGNVNKGMENVWNALDDLLWQHGYKPCRINFPVDPTVSAPGPGEQRAPSEIWAMPREGI
ncbi:MAG: hypothetical protein JO250_15280 [Armatimonadetes bacterium]|nr:hypothetical protein [Armatimonadota bacterium]